MHCSPPTRWNVSIYRCQAGICSHVCVTRILGVFFFLQLLVKHNVHSRDDGWHMWPQLPACTMTQEFTLGFHQTLPPTAALLTRAPRFNYWPRSALKPHQLKHTGNCLSQCKGANWIAGLRGKMCAHCYCTYLMVLGIVGRSHNGKLDPYPSSKAYTF